MNRNHICTVCFWLGLVTSTPGQSLINLYDQSGNLTQHASGSIQAPQILGQPQAQIVMPGEIASFSVRLADSSGCAYQWLFYATNLTGQTGDSLLILNANTNSQGPYSVVVTNTSGSVTSAVAQLYIDANRNGLPDSWELTYFGNLNQNAAGDFDGDGISNLQEFLDGTNPTNRTSFRSRLTVLADGGTVSVAPEQVSYALTDTVTLTGTPFAPNSFFGWTGDLVALTNPASLAMNTNKTIRACFLCQAAVSGLVGWWRGENDASDFIGGHTSTFYSGTNVMTPSISSNGMVGSAFVVYGTNYIQVQDASELKPAQLTIEAWVNPSVQSGSYQTVLAKGSAVNDDDTYYLGVVNGGASFWTKNSGGMNQLAGGSVPPNQWTHLAATFDGSTKRLYVNGILVAVQGGLGPLTYDAPVPLTIGSDWIANAPGQLFNGLLDEVSLFNRALGAVEITGLYLANVAGKCTNRPVFISPPQLADATQGVAYTQQVTTVLGALPVTFSLSAGSLPAGLTLSAAGMVGGIPTAAGSNVFAVLATDAAGLATELVCGLRVLAPLVPAMPAGIVSWWRAENDALDAVGTNHGVLRNGAGFAAGNVGQAFSLDGVSQSIDIPDALSLRPASLTLETWVLFNSTAGLIHIFAKPLGSGTLDSYGLYLFNGSLIGFIADNSGAGSAVSAGFSPPLGSWHHVAYTFDDLSKQQALYIDGAQVAVGTANKSIGYDSQPLLLGRDTENGTPAFFLPGRIDEASLYNRALSTTEIAGIYNAGAAGKVPVGPYLNTPSLPDALVGQAYTQTVTSVRGSAPVAYDVIGGALPAGLSLSSTGLLSGIPTTPGSFNFTVRATDAAALSNSQPFTIHVYAPTPPPPGLAGWWRGENNALDSVGTNNGVLRNGAGFAAGKVGQAFSLDGASQSIDIADAPALRPVSLTLETWLLLSSTPGTAHLFAKPLGAGPLDSYGIFLNGATLSGFISDTNGFGPFLTAAFAPAPGTWHHVAYTFDDASKRQALYVDGAQVATGTANKSIGYDTQPLLLGRDTENGSPNFFFPGRIDEAAIYSRALGSNEIASLYNAGPAGKNPVGPAFATLPVLPVAVVSQAYTQTLALARGTAQTFAVVAGAVPGLGLSSAGVLSGTPTATGTFSFVVRATDNTSLTADQPFTLQVLPRVVPPAGLVGWWRAENNTIDSVAGNNAFLINGATFAPGKVGQAFSLNGVSDAVEIEDTLALRPASVTLEAWVMFFSPNGIQSIISKTVGGGASDSFVVWLDNGLLRGAVYDITGAYNPISVPFSPALGQWYHLAFTFDDNTKLQVLYVNGVPAVAGISSLTIGYDSHPLFLGADDENGSMAYFLQGRIDEFSIYNRALAAAEMAAIYSADAAGKTTVGPYITNPPVLPDAAYGVAYSQTVTSVRGTPPVTYALAGGALPGGLTLSSQGLLSGTPTNTGSFNFTVRATDAASLVADQTFSLRVAAPVPPVAGLISWWRAENNALDAVGTNNGVALNGAIYAPGKIGQAFSLDGINDCVQIPDSPSLRPASLTIETWVRFNAAGTRIILAKPLGGGTLDSFAVWLDNGNLRAATADVTGYGPILTAPFSPMVGQWYHVAFTSDASTRQQVLYLNSLTLARGLADRPIAYDTNPMLLGCDSDNGSRDFFLQGLMDETAIYNRALTAAEIAAIFYAGAAGKTTVGPYFTTLPSLPDAIINQPYSQAISSARGTPPVVYALSSGSLPPGLAFSATGLLSGTPTNAGSFSFVVRATDAAGLFAEQFYTVTVYAPVPVPAGLIGWWRGESNAVDELGSHNGTLQGNATYGPGRVGAAFSLDGVNSFVDLGAWNAGSRWTLEAWVNPSSRPGGRHTIFGSLASCLDWSLQMNDGQLGAQIRPPGGCTAFLGTGFFQGVNTWYHLAATCDGTNASVYLNGVFSGIAAVDPNYLGNATGLRIGSAICCGEYFPGLVDEVSIYNRPLVASEIAAIYNAGPAGKLLGSGVPFSLQAAAQGGNLTLSFQAVIGISYTIESKAALDSSSWSTVTTVTATSSPVSVTLPITGAQQFYRARTGN